MKMEVYCDESCPEALFKKHAHKFFILGGLWLPAEKRVELKSILAAIRKRHGVYGEIKWSKVSPRFQDFYTDIIESFFCIPFLRFRAVVIAGETLNSEVFHGGDKELSFYRFYYQLLYHWMEAETTYSIFLDVKTNRDNSRLKELRRALVENKPQTHIDVLQGLPAHEVVAIQLADVLTGAVNTKFNNEATGQTKHNLVRLIEDTIGRAIAPTGRSEEKFNIFRLRLEGE